MIVHNTEMPTASKNSFFRAQGRLNRTSYLAWNFLSLIVLFVLAALFIQSVSISNIHFLAMYQPSWAQSDSLIIIEVGFFLLIGYRFICQIKRLHDLNASGWLSLCSFIPYGNVLFELYLIFAKGSANSNHFGEPRPSKPWEKIAAYLYVIAVITATIAMSMIWATLNQLN
ncbi:DUF805 domain-containing protein [Acinetobacter larvae]|uniref:DUF805 domain-containing protein n=1 Tax=Acinetobacter larvae TaxID=1789224 RepID=A0A1B2LW57_9GAMM|nr:DUF805 domain-containing protein [Acinetobacter larvae]AOA57129.1 hypothetical protein BFG52_01355 [Acinetobacter larvae]